MCSYVTFIIFWLCYYGHLENYIKLQWEKIIYNSAQKIMICILRCNIPLATPALPTEVLRWYYFGSFCQHLKSTTYLYILDSIQVSSTSTEWRDVFKLYHFSITLKEETWKNVIFVQRSGGYLNCWYLLKEIEREMRVDNNTVIEVKNFSE